MRVFGTIVVGFLFTVAFVAFFLFQSVTGYPLDPGELVGALRAADARTAALDRLEKEVRAEVLRDAPDPVFAGYVVSRARELIDRVITDEFFYGSIEKAHRGLVEFLDRGVDGTTIELGGVKRELRAVLLDLGNDATTVCGTVGAGRACYDTARDVAVTLRRYGEQIDEALDEVPDRANLTWLLTRGGVKPGEAGGSAEVRDVRRAFAALRAARWIGLAGLVALLGVVALINMRSLARVLVNVGAVAAVAAGAYLLAVPAAGRAGASAIAEELERGSAGAAAGGSGGVSGAAAGRVAATMVRRMTARAVAPVAVVFGAGLALVGGGIALHAVRRRRPGPPGPPPWAAPFPPPGPRVPPGAGGAA